MTWRVAFLVLPLLAGCAHPPRVTDPRVGLVETSGHDWVEDRVCQGPDLLTHFYGDSSESSWTYTSRDDPRCAIPSSTPPQKETKP